MKVIINNIQIDKETVKELKDDLISDLLFEIGGALGVDKEKPVTSIVYTMSHKDDEENDSIFADMFKKRNKKES